MTDRLSDADLADMEARAEAGDETAWVLHEDVPRLIAEVKALQRTIETWRSVARGTISLLRATTGER